MISSSSWCTPSLLQMGVKNVRHFAGGSGNSSVRRGQRVFLLAASLAVCALQQGCTLLKPVVEVNGKTAFTFDGGSQLALDEANLQLATMFPEASQPPKFFHYVLPAMTKEECKQGYEGLVKVQFLVDRDGRVSEVKILASPGAPPAAAVVRAVNQWVFSPMLVEGTAKEFKLAQSFHMKLR